MYVTDDKFSHNVDDNIIKINNLNIEDIPNCFVFGDVKVNNRLNNLNININNNLDSSDKSLNDSQKLLHLRAMKKIILYQN